MMLRCKGLGQQSTFLCTSRRSAEVHKQAFIPRILPRNSCIVAFKDTRKTTESNSTVFVPRITNFELLGLDRASCSLDEIKNAYEERVNSQTQAAYSADTLFSRAVLLKSAVECLLDPQRMGAEQKAIAAADSPGLKVFQSDLPGVLVVLQEVGCHTEVLSLGPAWLEANSSSPDAPDVAACIALAYCDRASLALDALEQGTNADGPQVPEEQPSPLLSACQDLEQAAQLCRMHDVAHQLQEQIADALKGYAHAYAKELVALPLGPAHASQRKRGVAIIRSALRRLLAAEDGMAGRTATLHADALGLLAATRPHLTAREQHLLLNDMLASPALALNVPHTSSRRSPSPGSRGKAGVRGARSGSRAAEEVAAGLAGELYSGAMALVAEGIARVQPVLVAQAEELLARVEAFERAQPQRRVTVRLDRACCAVLLGAGHSQALQLLGMPEVLQAAAAGRGLRVHGGGGDGPDLEACQFVLERSPEAPDDFAPGLLALTQGWLCEAVLGGLREWQQPVDMTAGPPRCLYTATAGEHAAAAAVAAAAAAAGATAVEGGNEEDEECAAEGHHDAQATLSLAILVSSRLQAYWFSKPMVAFYTKADMLTRWLPPLMAALRFVCSVTERLVAVLAAAHTRATQLLQQHARKAALAQQVQAQQQAEAQRERSARIKAAAAEAVARRRQQELQWQLEAEAKDEGGAWGAQRADGSAHGSSSSDSGDQNAAAAEGEWSETVEAAAMVALSGEQGGEMERLRARLRLGQDVEDGGSDVPLPPSRMRSGVAGVPAPLQPAPALLAAAAVVGRARPAAVAQGSMEQQLQQQGLLRHEGSEGMEEDEMVERTQALRRQLADMERAMWDSGAHVRMQRLMDDFQAKAATNTMMSGNAARASAWSLPPLRMLLPLAACAAMAACAAALWALLGGPRSSSSSSAGIGSAGMLLHGGASTPAAAMVSKVESSSLKGRRAAGVEKGREGGQAWRRAQQQQQQ